MSCQAWVWTTPGCCRSLGNVLLRCRTSPVAVVARWFKRTPMLRMHPVGNCWFPSFVDLFFCKENKESGVCLFEAGASLFSDPIEILRDTPGRLHSVEQRNWKWFYETRWENWLFVISMCCLQIKRTPRCSKTCPRNSSEYICSH